MGSEGLLKISVKKIQNGIQISVKDNGGRMETNFVNKSKDEHMGFALTNIQHRLLYHFGEKSNFTIESHKGEETIVSFVRPTELISH
jgi:two-component system sensor histidine kinase LytS